MVVVVVEYEINDMLKHHMQPSQAALETVMPKELGGILINGEG